MSISKKWAVIGVLATATEDKPDSIECIREGFQTKDDALVFATRYHEIPAKGRGHVDLYCDDYEGLHWIDKGGRCFIYARWGLRDNHDKLVKLCAQSEQPVVVIGECDLADAAGQMTRGKHAWIEAGEWVIDCGSYIQKVSYFHKDRYYEMKNAVKLKIETLSDITKDG